jgi:chromosome segregation ATPase
MSLDGLPQELSAFIERACAVLAREITAAKNIAAAANAEKSAAQAAVAKLQGQLKQAQSQLDAVTKDLQRLSDLVGVGHDIKKGRAELKRVQSETERANQALEARLKQCTEADSRLVALNLEANRMLGIRAEAEAVYADIRAKVNSVQLGARP